MKPSVHQEAICDFVENGTGSAIVVAVAGSGKTTTAVMATKHVPAGKSVIYLAFNKANAEELKSRGVNARTFHSLTYGPVTKARKVRTVEANKIRTLIDNRMGDEEAWMYGPFVSKMVGLGKQAGIGCLIPDTEQAWIDIANHHQIEPEHEKADFAKAIRYSSKLLGISNIAPMVDFDDLLYLAVKDGIILPKFDFVFVDEAQDTNAIQRAILRKIMGPQSRLIAVGDPAQAIYGFRGADSESLNLIASEFNATRLPLTVSYRCPTAVVAHARQWVDHIQPADGAPEGSVTSLGEWKLDRFQADDLVVCRCTAPLISLAYRLMKARKPVRVMGRDIGEGLKSLIRKMNAKGIPALEHKLSMHFGREMEKARAKKDDDKVESLGDKWACFRVLIESLSETDSTVPALERVIDSLFADVKNATVLATIHKAKGLEANRVYWLDSNKCPAKWVKTDWQMEQERNLCYVATTRAKNELILIQGEPEE